MLTAGQAFKAEFLYKCAQAGLSMDETHAKVKEAIALLESRGPMAKEAWAPWEWLQKTIPGLSIINDTAAGVGKGLGEKLPGLLAGAAIGAPILAGGLAGYGAAKAKGMNDIDPEEVKTNEKIEAYRRAIRQTRLQNALHARRNERRPTRPLL